MTRRDYKYHSSSGPGFLGWLTLLFVGLKLTGYIAWSWVWVLSPLWVPLAIFIAVALFLMGIYALASVLERWI